VAKATPYEESTKTLVIVRGCDVASGKTRS
jgi:hypothetical protein